MIADLSLRDLGRWTLDFSTSDNLQIGNQKSKIKIYLGCVAQTAEHASHKRAVGGSNPPAATNFRISDLRSEISERAGDVIDSMAVLQTAREGLNPSRSTT